MTQFRFFFPSLVMWKPERSAWIWILSDRDPTSCICGNKLDMFWFSATACVVQTGRSDIPWHCKSCLVENAGAQVQHGLASFSLSALNVNFCFHSALLVSSPWESMMNSLVLFHLKWLYLTFARYYNRPAWSSSGYTWSVFHSNSSLRQSEPRTKFHWRIFCAPVK